ncbi:MAG: glycosyl hydrolase [Trueperaceae bacterium]|nr:glycosyl hydrolase [Trueperaceae bacterium]
MTDQNLESTAMFGAFTYGGIWQGMEPVLRLEMNLGRRLDVVHWFTNWENPYFPELVAMASQGGRRPMISWQNHHQSTADIAAGLYDDYIRGWARGAATAPGVLYVRLFPEMNGSWTPWNGDPDTLVAAWRRVVTLFRQEGASNVRWVFSPNVTDSPRTPENAMERYYPGDNYVDVLALDGYNWGDTLPEVGWRSFGDVFRAGYDRITALGDQPVWLAELASSDEGGDKSAWVRDMFATTGFGRIEALVWFNEDKEADWRIDSDTATLEAFRASLAVGTTTASAR